ncbi:aminoglycoside phosphotransferase/kinase family protein [Streptomyces lancefieldiae]|uniref:Phosphotransferase n=1 Tax=Streptomyces lancefieldiae TaxID=3075520 RepID=A0ABU3AQA1_9ACTN|nr:phosphotransferase [Streptomyces sp. DSM 40712]MDT0612119.1 phosphotransferase [Streptomyces sp. DSM 40712]
MTTFLTPQQRADRTAAAVEAAVATGRGLGLPVAEPTVLHDLFSVVVHLAPLPVVVRIPTVLPRPDDMAAIARRQQDELDVTRWLADRGIPVIAPSPLVPREPVQRDGFSMTFWPFVEEARDKEPDYVANAESTADLHAALRAYPGRRLEFLSAADPGFIADSLAGLGQHPDLIGAAELDRARREWQILEPLVRSRSAFENRFPGVDLQPIHGDCPPANIFRAVDGDLYADFELVTLGPVEWDLAALGPEHEAAYNRGARRNGTRPLDEEVLAFVNALGALRFIATLALVPQLPELMGYLKPAVDRWQATPFAADMSS